jgi:autotransporter-associated beta strand protein
MQPNLNRTIQGTTKTCTRPVYAGWRAGILFCLAALVAMPQLSSAAVKSWTGGGANNYWRTGGNWSGGVAPVAGDDLFFQANVLVDATSLNNTNDFTAGTSFGTITFQAGATNYVLNGNQVVLSSAGVALSCQSSGLNTVNCPIQLGAGQVFELTASGSGFVIDGNINLNGHPLTNSVATSARMSIGGVISGSGDLAKTGNGTLLLDGLLNNTYSGTTRVLDGTLELNDIGSANAMVPGDVIIAAGATLLLTEANQIADTANVTVQGSASGMLAISGRLDLNGFSETIASLTLSGGGDLTTGAGTLTLGGNLTASASGSLTVRNAAVISGNLALGSATRIISVANNIYVTPELVVSAIISGSGTAGITKTGSGVMELSGSNTYPGATLVSGGWVYASSATAFGGSAAGTTLDGGHLLVDGVSIANEWLTNSSASTTIQASSGVASAWLSNVVLSANCTVQVLTNGTLTLAGIVSGTGGMTKTGPGTLSLSGIADNTYSGATVHNEGTLLLGKTSSAKAITLGSLYIGDGIGGVHADIVRYTAGNNQIYYEVPITITNSGWLDLNDRWDDLKAITLSGGDIDSGPAGELRAQGDIMVAASSQIAHINGRMKFGLGLRTITVEHGPADYNLELAATIGDDGDGFQVVAGSTGGAFVRMYGSNWFTGPLTISGLLVDVETPWSLGTTNGPTVVRNAGELFLYITSITNESLTLDGGTRLTGQYDCVWAGPITLTGNATISGWDIGSVFEIAGPIDGTGDLTFRAANQGTNRLSGARANSYSGTTRVYSGTLELNKSGFDYAIPHDLVVGDGYAGANEDIVRLLASNQIINQGNVSIASSGLLQINGRYDRFNALSGSGNIQLGAGGYIIPGDAGASSTFSGIASGTGYIWKVGNGVLTLTGDNTYTGTTKVEEGTLLVNGDQHQSDVVVQSTGTLGGVGMVKNVSASGNIAPGDSAGCLTVNHIIFGASHYYVELNGTTPCTGYDQLKVLGSLTLGGALHLSTAFPPSQPLSIGDQLVIVSKSDVDLLVGTFAGLPDGAEIAVGGYRFRINYGRYDVTLTAIGLPLGAVASAVTTGNGNHAIDPSECNFLGLVITNQSGTPMNDMSAVLSTTHPHAVVTQPYSDFPNIPAASQRTNITPFQLSTLASFPCGDNIPLQLQVTSSTHGSFVVPVTLGSGEPAVAPLPYNNNISLAIPDTGTVESTNVVAGFTGPLLKVAVSIFLTHPYAGDLSLSLISPDGVVVDLSSGNGGFSANFGTNCTPDSARTTFDDSAAVSITAGVPPFVGVFRPEGSLASLAGGTANGNWRLAITDASGGSLGTLRCWTLNLYGVSCADGGGLCDFCMGGIAGSIDAGDPVANRVERNFRVASCGDPKPFPGTWSGNYGYDLHSFPNTTGGDACVTVHLRGNCDVQATAYLNSFNPANVSQNYLGDAGYSTGEPPNGLSGPTTFSCTVPAGATLVVKVNEANAGEGCALYNLYVSGLPCPQPSLVAEPSGASQVRVHWPTWAGGYGLESAPSLPAASWTGVPDEPIVNGGRLNVTNSSASPDTRFYRLNKPQ